MNRCLKSLALLIVALTVALTGAAANAADQYLWIDDKGLKQLSDRPPPPSVPANRILKTPGKPVSSPATGPATAASDEPAAAGTAGEQPGAARTERGAVPPSTSAERNAAFNQRRADAAAADQKTAADAQQKADAAANCDAARQNQRTLDQGIRIGTVDKTGERGIMSDRDRAEFAKKNQKVLAGCQ